MKWLGALVLVVLGLAVYAPVWGAGWVMEDTVWPQTAAAFSVWHPRGLTAWTWTWTSTPLAAHLTSLGLHGLMVLLVGLYVWRLGLSPAIAWASAALVLVSPIAVETVAYAASRDEQIAAIGVLLACLCATLTGWWKWPLVMTAIGLGVLGKESALAALALVPLTLWMTRQPWRLVSALGIVPVAVVVLWRYAGLHTLVNYGDYALEISAWEWLLIQSTAVVRILLTLLTTSGMTPDFDYDRVPHVVQLICLGWVGLLGVVVWECRIRARIVTFALGWMLLSVALRLVVQTPTSYLSEHQFFTPHLGLLIGMAALLMMVGSWAARVYGSTVGCWQALQSQERDYQL